MDDFKNQYPMVHPLTFSQNPLIDRIANEKQWTVSDDQKRPVNAKLLLESGAVFNAKPEDDPLVTLGELDADQNLNAVNRAYRLHARDNRVIMIDVEPAAPDAMKQSILNFPGHYTELSKNGGVHVMILVPDDCITDENRYMFDELSVFKEPVPKGEQREAHYEVLFNDHYVTFTKKMLTQKPAANFIHDAAAKAQLVGFLNTITELDKQRKEERELAKQYRIEFANNYLSEEKQELVDQFISMTPFEKAKEQAMAKNVSDFGGDESRYEMSIANVFASQVLQIHRLSKDAISFRDMANALTEQDLVYAIYSLLKEQIPYRGKHDEDRDGLPWLLYTSKRAYEFILAQRSKKKK